MAFRALTDAECGQNNPLTKLTSHFTQDHTFSENHGQVFPSTSDQLVEQFLQETRVVPQSFRMDDLIREMHEIEPQMPPKTVSTIKDQIEDDAWAQQYLQDRETFQEDTYEEIWQQMSVQCQGQEKGNQIFGEAWKAAELFESGMRGVCSKVMQPPDEGDDVILDSEKATQDEAQAWTDEFLQNKETTILDDVWVECIAKSTSEEKKPSYWEQLQRNIEKDLASNISHSWLVEFNPHDNTLHREYKFSEQNPMLELPNPKKRGKVLLEQGDFPGAVLCFEAAAKQNPENAEAWLLLGTTKAENEQDAGAIAALRKCLLMEPTNLTALMAAAVSCTNESYYNEAYCMLISWLKNHPKYKDLVPPNLKLNPRLTVQANQKLVQHLYLKAARRNPQNLDYQVQSGLGILYHSTGEYDKAIDCFRAALFAQPNDARLWNRLGATLANQSKLGEAVEAYYHALNISPGFIRARYNLGVACLNLRAYTEAAEHFLTALNQQAHGKDLLKTGSSSQMSNTIWSTLQMCLILMNKSDVRFLVRSRNLQELNKVFNIDY